MKKAFLTLVAVLSSLFMPLSGVEQERPKPILVFDFGGVIAEADYEVLYLHLERALNLSRSQVMEVLSQLREACAKGIPEEQFWKDYATSSNTSFPDTWMATLDTVKQSAERPSPRMLELVKKLRSFGYRVAMLSNVQKHQAKIVRDRGLYLLFEPLVFSCEIGVEKPNIEAYQILLQRLHAQAAQCIMIDDSPENIEAAKRLGMGTILFQSVDGFLAELKRRNIPEEPRN